MDGELPVMNTQKIKVWMESVVRPKIADECSKDEHMAQLVIGMEKGEPASYLLPIYVYSVLSALADYKDVVEPLPDRMEDMTEPELGEHLSRQLRFIQGSETEDTIGSMLVIFQEDGITQYGATVDPETAPQALRELADRIERRESVKRGN